MSGQTAQERQREAFEAELAEHPDTPPTPTQLNLRLGRHRSNKIGWSKHRTQLLLEYGFTKNSKTGRWEKL